MTCASCGEEFAKGTKFCPECGTPVLLAVACKSCGEEIIPGKKFCVGGGTPVAAAASPEPQNAPAPPAPKLGSVFGGALKKVIEAQAETISCGIRGHEWIGCKCSKCGKPRNEGHSFQPVAGKCEQECSICGKIEKKHEYQPVSGACTLKCANCGKTKVKHVFQLVPGRCLKQCLVCGETEEIDHKYGDKHRCERCGQKEPRSLLDIVDDTLDKIF